MLCHAGFKWFGAGFVGPLEDLNRRDSRDVCGALSSAAAERTLALWILLTINQASLMRATMTRRNGAARIEETPRRARLLSAVYIPIARTAFFRRAEHRHSITETSA